MKELFWASVATLGIALTLLMLPSCTRVKNQIIDLTCPAVCGEAQSFTVEKCFDACDEVFGFNSDCQVACYDLTNKAHVPCVESCEDVLSR